MTAPARERVLLTGRPWADSVLWADDLAANQAAVRRHRPGHPAHELARYVATAEVRDGATVWRHDPVPVEQRPGSPVGREPDLTKSAGDVARAET